MGVQGQSTKSHVVVRLSHDVASVPLAYFTLSFLPIFFGNATELLLLVGPLQTKVCQW